MSEEYKDDNRLYRENSPTGKKLINLGGVHMSNAEKEWRDCAFCDSRETFRFSPNGRLKFYGCKECGKMTNPDGSKRNVA